jgi:hypothetical protein
LGKPVSKFSRLVHQKLVNLPEQVIGQPPIEEETDTGGNAEEGYGIKKGKLEIESAYDPSQLL